MTKPRQEKPFAIDKHVVAKAFKEAKANGGAPGRKIFGRWPDDPPAVNSEPIDVKPLGGLVENPVPDVLDKIENPMLGLPGVGDSAGAGSIGNAITASPKAQCFSTVTKGNRENIFVVTSIKPLKGFGRLMRRSGGN